MHEVNYMDKDRTWVNSNQAEEDLITKQFKKRQVKGLGRVDQPSLPQSTKTEASTTGKIKEREMDVVNKPPHYRSHPSGVECITITEHMNFNLGNAFKYIWRAELKEDCIQDLEKAEFYLRREINRLSGLDKERNR
jgi:hypothetical protein